MGLGWGTVVGPDRHGWVGPVRNEDWVLLRQAQGRLSEDAGMRGCGRGAGGEVRVGGGGVLGMRVPTGWQVGLGLIMALGPG